MRTFQAACTAAAVLALASPATAQIAVGAAGAKDWFQLGRGQDQQEILAPAASLAYDVVIDDAGMKGVSFNYRAMSSMDAGNAGALVSELGIDYWEQEFGGALEWFVGGKGEAWDAALIGDTKFLGGGRAGLRFSVLGAPFEVSGHYAIGTESVKHFGAFWGLRISNNPPEE